jgi:hypothetical protein
MRFRKLRIAWSVAWGLLAVLLIVVWVRSYWTLDMVSGGDPSSASPTLTALYSNMGTIYFGRVSASPRSLASMTTNWRLHSQEAMASLGTGKHFYWTNSNKGFHVRFPTWLPAIVLAVTASVPWSPFRWRFSIRTLLIAE